MEQIQELLDSVREAGSRNALTLDNVKGWLAEYLEMHAEETSRFPDQKNINHWDLIAADYDPTKDAHFIAAFFAGDLVTFLAGRGGIAEVRSFAQDDFPQNPNEVLDDLSRRFVTSDRWTISLDELMQWVEG